MNDAADLGADHVRAAVRIAREVGDLLVEMQHGGGLDACAKGDGSPLTRADRDAHAMLVRALPSVAPYLVVSEESAPHENAERLRCERVWIVDPLDGTRDYLKGSNEFTVNIALVERGVPILGVVAAPALGLTYYASRGGGAFCLRDGDAARRIPGPPVPDAAARIVVSRSDAALDWSRIADFAGVRVEAVSSAVKLGFIAEGSALAYPRVTPSCEWDIAAGHAVIREAGGCVIGAGGAELVYNKPDALNGAFVAAGSAAIATAAAEFLTQPLR